MIKLITNANCVLFLALIMINRIAKTGRFDITGSGSVSFAKRYWFTTRNSVFTFY